MRADRLIKAVNYVRNVMNPEEWNFAKYFDRENNHKCFVGVTPECFGYRPGEFNSFYKDAKVKGGDDFYGITEDEGTWLFPYIDLPDAEAPFSASYGDFLVNIPKERVCDRVMKFVNWKLQREHKWKQYEYQLFGQEVTDKRGVCV